MNWDADEYMRRNLTAEEQRQADEIIAQEKAIKPNGGATQRKQFALVPFDKITLDKTPAYLVEGLVPRAGLAVVWGPPKCGKSFFVFDLSMHVALGWEYQGRRVRPRRYRGISRPRRGLPAGQNGRRGE